MNSETGLDVRAPSAVILREERVNHKNMMPLLVVALVVAVGALDLVFQERSVVQGSPHFSCNDIR
jgi:hypothetical protein